MSRKINTSDSHYIFHYTAKTNDARERRKLCRGIQLPLQVSNLDSPDPESGVLPVTPRGSLSLRNFSGAVCPI